MGYRYYIVGCSCVGDRTDPIDRWLSFSSCDYLSGRFWIIVGGAFLIKSTGDRLYESTELMNLYLDGNEEAGRVMKTKGYVHLGITLAVTGAAKLTKPATTAFAKSKLGQGFLNLPPITAARQLGYNISSACGRYLMDGFANSSYGIIGALDLLNALSPECANMLCDFLVEYGTSGAETIAMYYENSAAEGVEEFLYDPSKIPALSKKAAKHAMNDHMQRKYANQLLYNTDTQAIEQYLSYKSFFNVSWSEEQVRAALNFGYKEAIGKGFYHGTYEFTYLGETVYVALDNGVFKTGYGVYHYTIEELKALLS